MRPLDPDFKADYNLLQSRIQSLNLEEREKIDPQGLRDKLTSSGFKFGSINPSARESTYLTVDCSVASRELRYHALWAVHAAAVYARYDGGDHVDPLAGRGTLPYTDLLYSTYMDVGRFIPYSDLDSRRNSMRVAFEFDSLMKAYGELAADGVEPDYLLVDGSLYTNLQNLGNKKGSYAEHADASSAFNRVLDTGKAVGLVEDSHATDLSRDLGYNFTNMLLFDIALKPGEYVSDVRDNISICYVKLPSKKLPSNPSGISMPLTVRWEFTGGGWEKDIDCIAGAWLSEFELIHPQLYPVRMADHLTRRVSVGGVLDRIVSDRGLELRYRELREG